MSVTDNKYIPAEDRDFFILLRIGLWQRVEEELSPSPDWSYIYRLACEQTVQGIVADGISMYKTVRRCNIPQDIDDKFLSAVAQIVRRNYVINLKQQEINRLLTDSRIDYYVVKGQMVGKCYPKPMLRCSGDIDYLMPQSQVRPAQDILAPLASSTGTYDGYLQHQDFKLGDIEVEIHGALHPRLGNRIDTVLDSLQDELFAGAVSYETFSCVYIFLHSLQHFHWRGLGIRQLTDWCMLLASGKDIDYDCVREAVSQMHIQQEWDAFYGFCVQSLGLQPCKALHQLSSRNCASATVQIWQEAKEGGNMGHNREVKAQSKNIIIRNTLIWIRILKTYFRHRSISPNTSLAKVKQNFIYYCQQL